MDNSLEYNNKLIGFDGFIARRDYFLNVLYLSMISTVLLIPQTNYVVNHIGVFEDVFNLQKILFDAPLLMKVWAIISALIMAYIGVGNATRRLNDIFGYVNEVFNILVSVLIIFTCFFNFVPLFLSLSAIGLCLILKLFLLLKKGKISKALPYDYLKEFNWGAYFGTWIWGLLNSSYKTLWIIPLSFTPLGFYFGFVCGLKGNEWAFKNKIWQNIEHFKKTQDKETIIFTVLSLIVVPIVVSFLVITLIVFSIIGISNWSKTASPNDVNKALDSVSKNISSIYFESYEIKNKENVFYVNPRDWQGYNFSQKKKIFDLAAAMAANERNAKNKGNSTYYSKNKELFKTKIFSSTTGELLAEFSIDEKIIKANGEPDFKEIFKAVLSAYKFYNPKK